MRKLPDFSAVIFDMDGLVLDTEKTYRIAWQGATCELGYDLSDDFFLTLAGLQYQDVENLIVESCGDGFSVESFRTVSTKHWHNYVGENGIDVKEGFFDLVSYFKQTQIRFCLATNSLKKNAEQCLQLAKIQGVFSLVVTRDQVEYGKPAPDLFLLAADLLASPIAECLVIEDSTTGVRAAQAAGAIPVFIPESNQEAIEISCHQYNNLVELTAVLKQST